MLFFLLLQHHIWSQTGNAPTPSLGSGLFAVGHAKGLLAYVHYGGHGGTGSLAPGQTIVIAQNPSFNVIANIKVRAGSVLTSLHFLVVHTEERLEL